MDFPSCFGEHAVQVADPFVGNGSRTTQNLVTSLYQTKFAGASRLITVTWCKNLMGQGLAVAVDDLSSQCTCKVDMKPWFFWKKKGCKSFEEGASNMLLFWDLSSAKFGSGPEPLESFFVAVVSDQEVVLLIGDMCEEAFKKTLAKPLSPDTTLISRREHLFGKTLYTTNAQFGESGRSHEIMIECQTVGPKEPYLCVRIDRQLVLQVKRLMWKFRGNHTIIVDDLPVELFWDVHNWFFNPNDAHAVFMFQTCLLSDKSWSSVASSTSLLQWQQTDNCCKSKNCQGPGFSLLLLAWKSEW
eukprot:c53373_g1_i1 orf=755-1654(+)